MKIPVQLRIDKEIDEEVRIFAVKNRMKLNQAVEIMLRHCLESRHFRAKYAQGTEKAIDY